MDDYILKVLLEQQDRVQEQRGEQVRKRLEEYLVFGEDGVAVGQRTAEQSEHGGPGGGTDEKEKTTRVWKEQQRTKSLERVLERIRQSEELQPGYQAEIRNGAAYPEQGELWRENLASESLSGGAGAIAAAFSANGQAQRWLGMESNPVQNAMEPEHLSMFFQRDARRYS